MMNEQERETQSEEPTTPATDEQTADAADPENDQGGAEAPATDDPGTTADAEPAVGGAEAESDDEEDDEEDEEEEPE